jgi:multidrug transporter EmrE-like cation transporter
MASFHLCSGVVCVALVSRLLLHEPISGTQLLGFGLLAAGMALVLNR